MTEIALVDNDVVLKLCRYGRHRDLPSALEGARPAMLSVGRWALRDRARRGRGIVDRDRVSAALEETFRDLSLEQPDEDEVALAAEMEEAATRRALELDVGESQLLAMALRRGAAMLLTGDKRAVLAIHGLDLAAANGHVACMEQLIATLLDRVECDVIRSSVCAEPEADRAVTACFACASSKIAEAEVRAGLASYVEHLRAASGGTLVAGGDLTVLTARTLGERQGVRQR